MYAYEQKFYVYDSDRIEYRQLLFGGTHPNLKWLKEGHVRYVPIKKDEDETVKSFEKKYKVKCKWASIGFGDDNHLGYQILPDYSQM